MNRGHTLAFYRSSLNMIKKILTITLWIALIVPLLILAQWIHPSNDDYCYYNQLMEYGFFEAQIRQYMGWGGRFTATMLIGTFLLDSSLTVYRLLPFVWLGSLVAGFLYFLKSTPAWRSKQDYLIAGPLFLFVFFDQTVNFNETIYWATGVLHYVFSVPGVLVVWAVLRDPLTSARKSMLFSILAFLLVGLSEFTALTLLFVIGLSFAEALYSPVDERKHRLKNIAIIGAITMIGTLIAFLAPGNYGRASAFKNRYDLPHAINGTITVSLFLLKLWFHKSPLLPLSMLYVIYLSRQKSEGPTTLLQGMARWLIPLALPATLVLGLFPSLFSTGGPPAGRTGNAIFFMFLIFWFASFHLFTPYYKKIRPAVLWIVFAGLMLHTKWTGGNYAQGVIPDLAGRAAAYDRELEARYDLIGNSKESDVVVPRLENKPLSIFHDDIVTDPGDWRNSCQARYFGKKTIRTSE